MENKDILVTIAQIKRNLQSKTRRKRRAKLGKQKSKKFPKKTTKAITRRTTLVMKHHLLCNALTGVKARRWRVGDFES